MHGAKGETINMNFDPDLKKSLLNGRDFIPTTHNRVGTDKQTNGIPVTLPPPQTSFSVPVTNRFLHKANEQTKTWNEVRKVERSANAQIQNIIMKTGGDVHTSFWDNLIEKSKNNSGSSSNPVIKIKLDSNILNSPLFNKQNTIQNEAPKVEEVEAEDIITTTTTTTTTMKPNEEFRMEIHTNKDGVSKISIVPQSRPDNNGPSKPCSPTSEDFNCVGMSPFDSVKSIGTWCLAKCLQGSCVDTVCSCSCNRKPHSSFDYSQGENMASALTTGENKNAAQIQSTLNDIYTSLRETSQTNNEQMTRNGEHGNDVHNLKDNSGNGNNEQNSNSGNAMDVQFLLRSIEGMIENKMRRMVPMTTPKPPEEEEIEAEDLQKPTPPSNNWNNNGNNNNKIGNNNGNTNWNNNGNGGNDNNGNNGNNWNNNNNNMNNNGNGGNNWNNNNNNMNNNGNNGNNNGNGGNNWNNNNMNNNGNNNWNNNGNNPNPNNNWNNNANNWNNNGNNWNNGNSNWNNNGNNNWNNNGPGPWQNNNWNSGPPNTGWNGPPQNWNQGSWNNGGSWGGPNNQWNNWGGPGYWNMAFSRRDQWQNNGGGEAAD